MRTFLGAAVFTFTGLLAPASGQGLVPVSIDDPLQPGFGSVSFYDESTGFLNHAPSSLQGVRFLNLGFGERTPSSEKDPAKPHLRRDASGLTCIVLPEGRGALYRFERWENNGSTFGFLYLDAMGAPHVLAELFVSSWNNRSDPFQPRVALAPDCSSFLVATNRFGGGDVFEISLVTDRVFNRTEYLPAVQTKPRGLALGATWGVIVTTQGVYRFNRAERGIALPLELASPSPLYFSGDVVFSPNGEHALTIAGESPLLAHAFAFSRTGAAVQVSEQPARMSQAGFLPNYLSGPYLAISDDRSLAAWRQETISPEGTPSAELFLARVPAGAPQTAEHLSSDARYLDTLDEVGQIFFVNPDTLRFSVGEKELGPEGLGLTDADVFTASMPPGGGGPNIVNLSKTNGLVNPPYVLPPEMKPREMVWVETMQRFVIFDDGAAEALQLFDPVAGTLNVLLSGVKDTYMLEVTQAGFLVYVRRTGDAGGQYELLRHTGALGAPLDLLQSTAGFTANSDGVRRLDGRVVYFGHATGVQRLSRADTSVGSLETLSNWTSIAPSYGFTPGGSVAFRGVDGGLAERFALWNANGQVRTLDLSAGTAGRILPLQ